MNFNSFGIGFIVGVGFSIVVMIYYAIKYRNEIRAERAAKEAAEAEHKKELAEQRKKYLAKMAQLKVKKGKEYEYFVGRYFKNQGYKIFPNGINKGKKDGGIDIVCHKDKETILIQCKNYKNPVKQDEIRKFIGDCYVYANENEKFLKDRTIRKLFVTTCTETKYAVEQYVKEHNNEVEYLVLTMEADGGEL